MSLRVWLPLTKDLRNQGLLDVTVTNNGATYSASGGKLGGCYNLDSTSINIGKPLPSPCTAFTVAGWVNLLNGFTINNGFHLLSFGQTYGRVCVSKDNAALQTLIPSNTGGTAGSLCPSSMVNTAIVAGIWHHYVVTYNAGLVRIYIDGNLDREYNISVTSFTYSNNIIVGTYNTETCKGLLNDYRLYDHALSQMEVKELSKGLVLHYPLNRGGWGQENLLKYTKVNVVNQNLLKTNVYSSWGNLTLTNKDGYDCYLYPSAQSSTWFSSGSWYSGMKANTTYTYTAWIYFTANASFTFTSLGHFQVYNSASTASDKAHEDVVSARIYQPSTIPANKWTKVRITFTTNNLANSYFVIYPRYNIAANTGDLYFRDCKLEESATPTPWCPHNVDNEYSTMGLNSTTEYDCSGFCNNGVRTGTFNWTSDTPKYNVSQVFNGTDNAIQTPNLTTMVTDKNYTIACWTYKTVIGTKNYQTIYGGPSGFELEARSSSSTSPLYRIHNWGGGTTTYNFGEWTHFCFVHTDSDSKLYVNGELKITGTSANIPSGNYFVGAWNTSTSQNYEGLMSDFRIYATALSADDVKSLYQNSAYIDSSGNVYGAVHSEV